MGQEFSRLVWIIWMRLVSANEPIPYMNTF